MNRTKKVKKAGPKEYEEGRPKEKDVQPKKDAEL
jgi:hypothetical protein